MTKSKRGRYTLEFKQEAVRLVESGQSPASVARMLGVVEQTLGNWVKAHRAGSLQGAGGKAQVTAEQMEISRLRAELARVTMERDILHPTDEGLSAGTSASTPPTKTCRRGPRPGKSDGVLRQGAEVRYAFVERHKKVWPIRVQCRAPSYRSSSLGWSAACCW